MMMKKLNWGWGIAIFYSLFVLVMVGAVVKSSQLGVDLVQEKYYDADIAYEEFRQSRANASVLDSPPAVRVYAAEEYISIDFHSQWSRIEGKIQMYNPSDVMADKVFDIEMSQGLMKLPTSGLKKGRYTVKMTWEGDGKPYYIENTVVI